MDVSDILGLFYISVYLGTIAYVVWDGYQRGLSKISLIGWGAASVFTTVLMLPFYWASRPLKQGEAREGGYMWNLVRNSIAIWTIFMLLLGIYTAIAGGFRSLPFLALIALTWFFPTQLARYLGKTFRKVGYVERGPTGPLRRDRPQA